MSKLIMPGLLVVLAVFTGCDRSDDEHDEFVVFQGAAMTIPYRILVEGPLLEEENEAVKKILSTTFQDIDHYFNKWNPHSELSTVNKSMAGKKIKISPTLYDFLILTGEYVGNTGGLFDPTIEPIQKLWKEALIKGKIPSNEEIQKTSSFIGWDKIILEDGVIEKRHEGVEIDLGGIAKGHAVDLLTQRLTASGHHNLFVEWGGEIRTSGNHPSKRPWRIYISKFGDTNPAHATDFIELYGEGIATSGDYLQQWTVDKTTYFHIIDPRTLRPLTASHTSIASVTVKAKSCLEADALATAAMIFPSIEEAEKWSKTFDDVTFWIFSRASQRD